MPSNLCSSWVLLIVFLKTFDTFSECDHKIKNFIMYKSAKLFRLFLLSFVDIEQFSYFSQVFITLSLFQDPVRKTKKSLGFKLILSFLSPSRNGHSVENIPQNNTDNFTISKVKYNSLAIILPILEMKVCLEIVSVHVLP